jgi:hypothetical protein
MSAPEDEMQTSVKFRPVGLDTGLKTIPYWELVYNTPLVPP